MSVLAVLAVVVLYALMICVTAYCIGYFEGRGWIDDLGQDEGVLLAIVWPVYWLMIIPVTVAFNLVERVYRRGRSS